MNGARTGQTIVIFRSTRNQRRGRWYDRYEVIVAVASRSYDWTRA